MAEDKLVEWVLETVEDWRDNRDENYKDNWDKYERIWRGVWDGSDKQRQSERSKIISPATQQAIENHTSEIEEGIWGSGANFFDIEDDFQDKDPTDIEYVKLYLHQEFKLNKLRKNVNDVLLMASIYGTGIGEIITKEEVGYRPATQKLPDVGATAIGVEEYTKVSIQLKPIHPRNFLIDPTATSIEEAMGVAIEEFVGAHVVAKAIKDGIYLEDAKLGESEADKDLEPSSIDSSYDDHKVKLIKYYGLVPRVLLESPETEVEELFEDEENEVNTEYGDMVEAIVVIGNESTRLKADASPYMMKDRPLVAYQDDTVPGRFWGRGVAEKGYNMQAAIDAQLRSHFDSLALTTVPMMAMDALRMPRGAKMEIKPGKTILTNGNPAEILQPFKFGAMDGGNIQTAEILNGMLLQATGTLDTASLQSAPMGGDIGISLSGIIKKNKRTLVNFQENFLIPFIQKAAWRYMQFDPENFPVQDFTFVPSGSLGMLAREVEQIQFINLLKTLGSDNPLTPVLLQGVIQNSTFPNKQEMLQQIAQSNQPSPEQQQLQQLQVQAQVKDAQLSLASKEVDIAKKQAETQQIVVETQLYPDEVKAKLAAALSNNLKEGTGDDVEFQRRAKIAELMLKEKDINLKEKDLQQNAEIVKLQMASKAK